MSSSNVSVARSLSHLLRRLWGHISGRRRTQFGVLFLLMVVASIAEVVSIGAILPFLGALTSPETVFRNTHLQPIIRLLDLRKPSELLLPLTVIFSVAAVFSGAMRLLLLWLQTRLSYAVGADFSTTIYRRTLFQPYEVHLARNTSEVISGITGKANGIVNATIMPLLHIASSCLILLAILSALVLIDPITAISTLFGFAAVYGVIILMTRSRLAASSRDISRESNNVIKALQEGLGGIRDVLIDGTHQTYSDVYSKADSRYRKAVAHVVFVSASPRSIIEALGLALIAGVAYTLATSAGGFAKAVPVLGALAVGAQRMLPVLQQAYSSWTTILGGKDSLQDTLELLGQPVPEYLLSGPAQPLEFTRDIALGGVSFFYSGSVRPVLDGVTFRIQKGERIGIIGTTGSGKTTLLDILMGLLQPSRGQVSIDGLPLTQGNNRSWQAHIAHVPQSIFLSDATISENIAFGVPPAGIDRARVRAAAEKAQLANTIESWDDAYETMVGERGVRLSGGQRQRIGIARALYKQADVLVFDEATSALDTETESAVMASIESLNPDLTIIIVAHRLTTLRTCAQIIELENGKVKRTSSYAGLLAAS